MSMPSEAPRPPRNPLDPAAPLHNSPPSPITQAAHPQAIPLETDSAVTKAEKYERHPNASVSESEEPSSKRIKLDAAPDTIASVPGERQKGVVSIKAEFLVNVLGTRNDRRRAVVDDDAAEASPHLDSRDQEDSRGGKRKKEKNRGQNKSRTFGSSRDERGLCQSRATYPEFSPAQCKYGDNCKFEHDLRKYLKDWKREDLSTFGGECPIWALKGKCDSGFKCRFAGSHMKEQETSDGKQELLLVEREGPDRSMLNGGSEEKEVGIVNVISTQAKADLLKRKTPTPKADEYAAFLDKSGKEVLERSEHSGNKDPVKDANDNTNGDDPVQDIRAQYVEPPFLPSEKRRIYFGPETPVLAPLTTQGNLPFRRLCIAMGAQITYSEMAMSMPLIQGQRSEWALMKAHESETRPPRYSGGPVVADYDNSRDSKFGAQIAGNKALQVLKATEIIHKLCPQLRVIDLNCGCPIDLVYRQGAGSALLDSQSKLEKILRGMNAVSGEIPITVKIRMGTRDGKPNAVKLINRLVYGGSEASELGGGASGVAAITLHGRSRQQRYTRSADWEYIADCAALINRHNERGHELADTNQEVDARYQPAGGKVYFIGNGDCYSHVDYNRHLSEAKVDSVMVARGALIKPWIFEEIEQGQYLDKSATERLAIIAQYVRYGLEAWGSDEMGVGTTRRFLLEWLSFACRYVPVGIMEHLPPNLQDRPPAWRGRNELETLLGSDNYLDWIKISEMFLGPAHKDFRFEPKHKSSSYGGEDMTVVEG
ncbi:tRNA-dihydrouridine synthase 3 [Xylographa opegraphella]|nr:tRNA-dihydrouridine synthase 3 [Xylographa opegraphella]